MRLLSLEGIHLLGAKALLRRLNVMKWSQINSPLPKQWPNSFMLP